MRTHSTALRFADPNPRRTPSAYGWTLLIAVFVVGLLLALAQPPIYALVIEGDFIGAAATFGWQEDNWQTIALLNVHNLLAGLPCCQPLTD